MMKKWITKREIIWSVLWIVLVTIGMLIGKKFFVNAYQDDFNDPTAIFGEEDLGGSELIQPISVSDKVEKLSFIFVNKAQEERLVHLSILDARDDSVIVDNEFVLAPNNGLEQLVEWSLAKDVDIPNEAFVKVDGVSEVNEVYVCMQNITEHKPYFFNGDASDNHLRMAVVYGVKYQYGYAICVFLLSSFLGLMFFVSHVKNLALEQKFAVIAILGGMIFAFINPFGQEPDGWVHFLRSMDVSSGNVLLPLWDNNGGSSLMRLPENINDIQFSVVNPNAGEGISYMENVRNVHFTKEIVDAEGLGGFTSLFYLPQALGICIARVFGLSAYGYMIWGRIINLLTYVALTYLAVKKTPIFRNLFMVVALLPMTLYQAASFSYDATLMGLCFLFTALCFEYAYKKDRLSWKNVIWLGVILGLLFTCKYVYVCIGLLVFLIPMKKFEDKKAYWKSFAIALIPFVAIVLCLFMASSVPSLPGSGAEGSEVTQVTQLDFILQNPLAFVKTFVRTITMYFSYYMEQLNTLGWLKYTLGALEFVIPMFMISVAVLDGNEYQEKINTKNRVLMFLTFVTVISVGLVGLYLFDSVANPVGAPTILGYQGRYTIPVLILGFATFNSNRVKNEMKDFSNKVTGICGLILVYASVMVFGKCY